MLKIDLSLYPAPAVGLFPGLLEVPSGHDGFLLHPVKEGLDILLVVVALEGQLVLLDAFVGEDVLEELVMSVQGFSAEGRRERYFMPVLLGDGREALG